MKDFFGSKKQQSTQAPTGFQTLPGFAQTGLEQAVGAGQGFLQDPSIFGAAPITPEQQQAIQVLQQGAQPLGAERFGEQLDVFQNPFLESTLDPALEDLSRVGRGAFGDIGAQASQAGAFGSTRQGVQEAELGRLLGQEAGRLSANVRTQGFESAADRALKQLGAQQTGAKELLGVGEFLRSLQQQNQQAPIDAARLLSSLSGNVPIGGGPTSGTATSTPSFGSILGSGLRTAGGLGALSDRRAKENIKFIRHEAGHNIYQFVYRGGEGVVYEGVMADEVQGIVPEAVEEIDGYLRVDYSKIGPDFRRVA